MKKYLPSIPSPSMSKKRRREQEKNKSPLISVTMATHNRATLLLPRAIESILNQTFTNFEFIIVDDGSTDETQSVLKDYQKQDNRIVITYQPNGGLAAARNHGLRLAKGKYIALMDDDDISMPKKLEKQLLYLENSPSEMACVCSYYYIGQNRVIARGPEHSQPLKESPHNLHIPTPFILSPMSFFNKQSLLAIGGWRPVFTSAQDLDLTLRFQEKYSAGVVQDFLFLYSHPAYFKHPQISSQSIIRRLYCHISAYASAWYRRYKGYDPLTSSITESTFIQLVNPLPKQIKRAIFHSAAYMIENMKEPKKLDKKEIEQLFRIMLLCNTKFRHLKKKVRRKFLLNLIKQRRWQEIAFLLTRVSI